MTVSSKQQAVGSKKSQAKRQMSKKVLCFAFCAMLLALSSPAEAQEAGKVYRIGYVSGGDSSGEKGLLNAFQKRLRELGWTEGNNITIEYRYGGIRQHRRKLLEELVRRKVDVIVTRGTSTARSAKKATDTIPIVMTTSSDPVGAEIIESLARPGGNVTGNTSLSHMMNWKKVEFIKAIVPRLTRVGVLVAGSGRGRGTQVQIKEIKRAAQSLDVKLLFLKFKRDDPKGLENAFEGAVREKVDAIIPTNSSYHFSKRKEIIKLAATSHLPAIYQSKGFVEDGGLISYGVSYSHLYRRAAEYVDKVLKGAKPSELPVQQPTKFELFINLKTAKAIDVTIPPAVLYRADKVIR